MELANHPSLARIVARAAADPEILAVILFGTSSASTSKRWRVVDRDRLLAKLE